MPVPKNIIQGIYHKLPNYWLQNGSGEYVQLGRADTNSVLRQRCALTGFPHVTREEITELMARIALEQSIDYIFPCLPGYPVGLHQVNDTKILVPEELTLIKPAPGKADLIEHILLRLLGLEQLTYLLAWLQIGYKCLKAHVCKPGQVVILAGPRNSGKSLIQEQIITPIFGGAIADPYPYAVGRTPFNQDHFRAMHLAISDQKNPSERIDMQEFIRRIASNDFDSLHPKHKEAISLKILWRMSVSCNEEERDLRIIPPLDGLEDKLLLLKCDLHPMPMPTAAPAEYKAFGDALGAELPAFIHNLLAFKIPDQLRHERFGVKGHLCPELARMVHQLDPEEEVLELIRDAKKAVPQMNLDDVTANEVHQKIHEQNNLRPQLLSIAKGPRRLGWLLGKLADRNDGTVTKTTLNRGYQEWTIKL
jgi:hypothetical protein